MKTQQFYNNHLFPLAQITLAEAMGKSLLMSLMDLESSLDKDTTCWLTKKQTREGTAKACIPAATKASLELETWKSSEDEMGRRQ